MRFHSQTAGVTLTAQQPLNNIVRVAYQALAAVLGGTQSLHTNSLDETLALPTEQSVQVALRTQQILAHETGVAQVIDPLGGAYYIEALTDQLEREAEALFAEINSIGGVVRGIESGWFQRQIAQSAAVFQRQVEMGEKVIVGVNEFLSDDDDPVEILKVSNDAEEQQRGRIAQVRAERDNALVERRHTPTRRATLLRMAQIYGERFADPDGRIRATFEVIWLSGWAPHESQQQPLKPGSAKASLAEAVKGRTKP